MIQYGSVAPSEPRRFRFHSCIGVGGFGEVYLAEMVSAGGVTTNVAVKLLLPGVDPKSSPIERLRDEGKLLGLLDHPVILRVTDLVVLDGRAGLVTQYVDGCDLDACFSGVNLMPEGPLFEVIGQVADALHHAFHATGPDRRPLHLVHRDIKPSNIRLGRHGEVKLLDFGIARANNPERETQTQIGLLVGTRSYMSPERFDESPADAPSDVYALGCIAYEGIAHRRLFRGLNLKEHIALANNEATFTEFVERHLQRLSCEPDAIAVMRAMLAFDPAVRPSASEVRSHCEELARHRAPVLKTWLRGWTWPTDPDRPSVLVGKTLLEGSSGVQARPVDRSAVTAAEERPAPTQSGPVETLVSPKAGTRPVAVTVAAGVVGAIGLMALGGAVLLVGMVGFGWFGRPSPAPPPAAVAPAIAPVAAAPAPEAPVAAEPAPSVAPPAVVAADPGPKSAPAPRPSAVPAPAAPAATRTEIRAADLPVELRGPGGTHKPGAVAAGSYEIWADFGSGLAKAGSVSVAEGQSMHLRCSRMKQTCSGVAP